MYTILLLSHNIKLRDEIRFLINKKGILLVFAESRLQAEEITKTDIINMFIVAVDENAENLNFIKQIKSNFIYKYTPVAYITSHTNAEAFKDFIFCYRINMPLCQNSFKLLENIIHHDMTFYMNEHSGKYIILNNASQYLKLKTEFILFFEAFGHETIIYTTEGAYTISFTLKEIETLINNDSFLRCHRSYIINIDNIYKIEKTNSAWEVYFYGCEKTAFISRQNKQLFISALEKVTIGSVK